MECQLHDFQRHLGTQWVFISTSIIFTNNAQYRIDARATDNAGNQQVLYSSRSFTFAPPAPASVFTAPVDGSFYRTLTSITG